MIHSNANRSAGFTNAANDQKRTDNETEANLRTIENHKKAAEHFTKAADLHYEAARYHGEGNHSEANECTLKAMGHSSIAQRFQERDCELIAIGT